MTVDRPFELAYLLLELPRRRCSQAKIRSRRKGYCCRASKRRIHQVIRLPLIPGVYLSERVAVTHIGSGDFWFYMGCGICRKRCLPSWSPVPSLTQRVDKISSSRFFPHEVYMSYEL